jgi:hypothetical protein
MAQEDAATVLPLLESSQVYATLLASYDFFKPDVAQLGRAGHPAFYERSATPNNGDKINFTGGVERGDDDEEEESQPVSPSSSLKSKIPFFGSKKRRNSKVKMARRRLQVQFPRKVLLDSRTVIRQPPFKTVESIEQSLNRRG